MQQISHAELHDWTVNLFLLFVFFYFLLLLKRCLFLPLECTDTALHHRPSIMAVQRSARSYSYENRDKKNKDRQCTYNV